MDESFIKGYRETSLEPNEVIVSVTLPYTAKVSHHMGSNTCTCIILSNHILP